MTRPNASVSLLRSIDALCAELQGTCGLTRISIVVDRSPLPLTVTFENQFHVVAEPHGGARMALELRDGDRRLGEVVLEDALAYAYPDETRTAADAVLARHLPSLRSALPR